MSATRKVTLLSKRGIAVATIRIPKGDDPPDVIQWGATMYKTSGDATLYRECSFYFARLDQDVTVSRQFEE